MSDESDRATLLRLRIAVGFLGERAQFAWWPTAFYEASSRLFLEPAFAKTSRLAQYHGVVEAARRLHDEHLSVGSYHLFRLPEEIEQDMHAMVLSREGGGLGNEALVSKETALDVLKRLAATPSTFSPGPVVVGSSNDIYSAETLKAIARVYSWAFGRSEKVFPYLVRA